MTVDHRSLFDLQLAYAVTPPPVPLFPCERQPGNSPVAPSAVLSLRALSKGESPLPCEQRAMAALRADVSASIIYRNKGGNINMFRPQTILSHYKRNSLNLLILI